MSTEDPMRPDDPMRLVGATWCDQHRRWECARNAKGGKNCHGSAITGTDRCRMHAGQKSSLVKVQGEAITAWSALSGQPNIAATDAVLGMLQMSWLRVHLYAKLLEEQVDEGYDVDGLVLETTAASPGIGTYTNGETIRALAQLDAQERDRCVRYAKTAHDMGIAEKQIALAEQHGSILAEVMRRVLAALNLTEQQWILVPQVVPRELRALGLIG